MTISSETNKFQYQILAPGVLDYDFSNTVYSSDTIEVSLVDSSGVVTVQSEVGGDYSSVILPSNSGLRATFAVDPYTTAPNGKVILRRAQPLTQGLDYGTGDEFPAGQHERGLDQSALRDQTIEEQLGRGIFWPITETTASTLQPKENFKGKVFVGDAATGDPIPGEPGDFGVTPIAAKTLIGNNTASTGVPTAIPMGNLATNPNIDMDDQEVTADGSTAARDLSERFADVVNVKDFGAVGDGVTDDTAAIQAAINANSNIAFDGKKSYKIDGTVSYAESCVINGNGCTIIGTSTPFELEATMTTTAQSFSLSQGDVTVPTTNIPDAIVGSVVVFRSSTVRLNPGPGLEYYYGQTVKIERINAGTATFYPPIAEAFSVSEVDVCDPCEQIEVHNMNIDVTAAGTTDFGAKIRGSNVYLSNVSITGTKVEWTQLFGGSEQSQLAGVYIDRSVNVRVDSCSAFNIRATGSSWGYGIAVYGSNVVISGCVSYGCRHAFDIGDRPYTSVNGTISGCVAGKDETISDWMYAIGTHANVIGLSITGCTAYGQGLLICIRNGDASVTGNSLLQNRAFTYADGEASISIQEMPITSVTISGNTFAGRANTCVEVFNGSLVNNPPTFIGNAIYPGSTIFNLVSGSGIDELYSFSDPLGLISGGAQERFSIISQVVESIYNIATPSSICALMMFDSIAATETTVSDRSSIAGATASDASLRDNALTPSNASAFSPNAVGILPSLEMDNTHTWDIADSDKLSFGDGATDSPFSMVWGGSPTAVGPQQLITKFDLTSGSTQREYIFELDASTRIGASLYDDSTGGSIGRRFSTALTGDIGEAHVYGMSYDGAGLSSGIAVYRDGAQVDDTNQSGGTYTAMENKTADVGGYYLNSSGSVTAPCNAKVTFILITAEELDSTQMARIASLLRGHMGEKV